MKAVREMLANLGYDMSRYHEESFGETPPDAIEDAEESAELAHIAEETPQPGFCVEFIDEGMSVTVSEAETIHAASTKLGIRAESVWDGVAVPAKSNCCPVTSIRNTTAASAKKKLMRVTF